MVYYDLFGCFHSQKPYDNENETVAGNSQIIFLTLFCVFYLYSRLFCLSLPCIKCSIRVDYYESALIMQASRIPGGWWSLQQHLAGHYTSHTPVSGSADMSQPVTNNVTHRHAIFPHLKVLLTNLETESSSL